jgi:hypothetical protein
MGRLANEAAADVRKALASNPNVTSDVLLVLVRDYREDVAAIAEGILDGRTDLEDAVYHDRLKTDPAFADLVERIKKDLATPEDLETAFAADPVSPLMRHAMFAVRRRAWKTSSVRGNERPQAEVAKGENPEAALLANLKGQQIGAPESLQSRARRTGAQ